MNENVSGRERRDNRNCYESSNGRMSDGKTDVPYTNVIDMHQHVGQNGEENSVSLLSTDGSASANVEANVTVNLIDMQDVHRGISETVGRIADGDLISWNDFIGIEALKTDSKATYTKPQLVEAINQQLLKTVDEKPFMTDDVRGTLSKNCIKTSASNECANNSNVSALAEEKSGKDGKDGNDGLVNDNNNTNRNETNTVNNEQHQTSIREFKRLGTYCTLRPEQRRKHLLKVLPALRHSNLLQTLLMQRNLGTDDKCGSISSATSNGRSHTDLDALLTKLDEIVVGRRGHMKNASAGSNIFSSDDNARHDQMSSKLLLFSSENVEDCLLELDAYLEEIDREYALTCTYGGAANCNLNRQQPSHLIVDEGKDNDSAVPISELQVVDDGPSSASSINLSSMETIDLKEMETADQSSDQQSSLGTEVNASFIEPIATCADDNMSDTSVFSKLSRRMSCSDWNLDVGGINASEVNRNDGDGMMKRKSRTRQTIGAFKNIALVTRASDRSRTSDVIKQKAVSGHRVESWRRHSMRKTRPILLPKPSDLPQFTSLAHRSDIDDIETGQHDDMNGFNEISIDIIVNDEPTHSARQLSNGIEPVTRSTCFDDNFQVSEPHSLQTDEMLEILAEMDRRSSDDIHLRVDVNGCDANERPRQLGRRAESRSRIVSITAERISESDQRIIINRDGTDNETPAIPQTANLHFGMANESTVLNTNNDRSCTFNASEPSSGASSRNPSPVSIISSSASSSIGSTTVVDNDNRPSPRNSSNTGDSVAANGAAARTENRNSTNNNLKSTAWPNGLSRILAATCCTLGLFNISRFAIFSIHFGANFMVQFLILSFIFGIPMLWLQMCLGANIKGGPISMWRISPICKGIGIALVLVQALVALYSAVSISWILVYLRDSCVTSAYPWYRWQETFEYFRGTSDYDNVFGNATPIVTSASKLGETVADYFNGVVLQRYQLGPGGRAAIGGTLGAVRFQLGFNLTVSWLIVFIVLCKGLKSYGKIVIVFMALPLLGLGALCIKLVTLINTSNLQSMLPTTDWQDFFINSQSWLSAAQEVFLTWTLHGASIISIFSQSTISPQQKNTVLRRDALVVIFLTLTGLFLAAILGNACVHILNDNGYYYFPGSFETMSSSVFLLPSHAPIPAQLSSSPSKWLPRYSSVLGESYLRSGPNSRSESGWQAIRLVTELFPATVAAATHEQISSFWSLLGFFLFLCFAMGQLCAMWKPIAGALGNYSSTSVTSSTVLLTCLSGLLLGVPLATESGINIIHFLDIVLGGAWFVLVLWTGQIFAIFLVRGRPYSGDILVNDLHLTQTLSAFVALSWNLLLPIGLMTLSILEYRLSLSYGFYHWYSALGPNYWPMWTRKSASFIQIGILLIVPITAIVQIYRYLSRGPPDILERIQLLYRPSISSAQNGQRYPQPRTDRMHARTNNARTEIDAISAPSTAITLEGVAGHSRIHDDAPPKYTPPPSYTTATGARIAKMLRNSIRRSVRRIMGEPSGNMGRRERPGIQNYAASTMHQQSPPAYSTISYNNEASIIQTISTTDMGPIQINNAGSTTRQHSGDHHRRHTTTNFPITEISTQSTMFSEKTPSVAACHTMPRLPSARRATDPPATRILTAQDVAQLLRPSTTFQIPFLRGQEGRRNTMHLHHRRTSDTNLNLSAENDLNNDGILTRSVDDLVANAALVGQSDAAATTLGDSNSKDLSSSDNNTTDY